MKKQFILLSLLFIGLTSCNDDSEDSYADVDSYPFVEAEFGTSID